MAARILDGTKIAAEIRTEVAAQAKALALSGLRPGLAVVLVGHNVAAEASGFASKQVNDLAVLLNQNVTLDLSLDPASVKTVVEVSEAGVTIDTTTAQLESTFDSQEMTTLPAASQGSGVLNLALLNAGVSSAGGLGSGSGGPSVSGQRAYNNNFTVEGVDNNNKNNPGPVATVPDDAVASLSVLQNQFSPEFGHSNGGQFNTVVLSGTNSFHGRVYEYFQNRNLNAIDSLCQCTQNPRYDNNRFGGQVGGPIIKDKLFFFQNLEYNPTGYEGSTFPVLAPTSAGYTTLNSLSGLSQTISRFCSSIYRQPLKHAGLQTPALVQSVELSR